MDFIEVIDNVSMVLKFTNPYNLLVFPAFLYVSSVSGITPFELFNNTLKVLAVKFKSLLTKILVGTNLAS